MIIKTWKERSACIVSNDTNGMRRRAMQAEINDLRAAMAEPPTEAQVMAAARAISDCVANSVGYRSQIWFDQEKERYIYHARAALKAAWEAK